MLLLLLLRLRCGAVLVCEGRVRAQQRSHINVTV